MILTLYILYYLSLIIATIYSMINKYPNTFVSIFAIFTVLILPFIFKLFKYKLTYTIHLINVLFIFTSNIWGSILNGYSIHYFDKILHFTSGLFITELAFILYVIYKNKYNFNKKEILFCIIFINSFNMLIAVYWEFIEFFGLVFLKHDAIHHYSSGVFDSMQDMLVCNLGGMIVSIFIYMDYKTKYKSIFYHEMVKLLSLNKFVK